MKIVPLAALAAAALLPAAQADATAYVRDVTVYLSGTEGFTTQLLTPFVDFTTIASLTVGDTITGTVSFKSLNTDAPVRISYVNNSAAGTFAVYLLTTGNLNTTEQITAVDGQTTGGVPLYTGVSTNNFDRIVLGGIGGFQTQSFSLASFGYSVAVTGGSATNIRAERAEISNGSYATIAADPQPPVRAVPEPATWGMFIGGFGLIGTAMRRRRRETPAIA